MNDPKQVSPRHRMQELLAVPERERTDAQWDELHELEIMLAPVNRGGRPQEQDQNQHRNASAPGHHSGQRSGPPGGKPGKRFRKRMPKGKGR